MASNTPRPPPEIEEKLKEYKVIEAEVQELFSKKQAILAQLNENTLVQGELDMITDEDSKVYKLVGPLLVRVEHEEAKQNVKKRLEFIEGEVKKIEGLIDAKQSELNEKGKSIQETQQRMQAEAAEAAKAVAAEVTAGM